MMMEEMIVGYEQSLVNPDVKRKPKGEATEPIQFVLKQALKRKWRHLAEWNKSKMYALSIPSGKAFLDFLQWRETRYKRVVRARRSPQAHGYRYATGRTKALWRCSTPLYWMKWMQLSGKTPLRRAFEGW